MSEAGLLVLAARVHTMDAHRPLAEALRLEGGRVVAVGSRAEVEATARPGDRRLELPGATVLPGLIDAHVHLLSYGLTLTQLDLSGARSLGDLAAAVAEAAGRVPAGRWILGRGWDQERLAERRWPTRHDLDAAAPHHPVLLRRVCGHVAVANSLALRLAGVGPGTPDPPGGRIARDVHGEPTGLLLEAAVRLVADAVPPPDAATLREAALRAVRRAHAAGLTAVHSQDVWAAGQLDAVRDAYASARAQGAPLRVYALIGEPALDELRARGWGPGWGDEWFAVGPIKLFADGTLGAATAAVREPYVDPPGERGTLVLPPEELAERVLRAHAAGFQVAVHAIGDAAADAALDAFAAAQRRRPRSDPRHRLIHCQVMRPDQWPRMRQLGVVADVQPKFVGSDWRVAERRLGPERARTSYAWRSILAAGVVACGGSDAPVEPLEPMLGVYAAVTRCDLDGRPPGGWQPQERLDVATALSLFTRGAAFAAFAEGRQGVLAPGALGDLVAFDEDPLAVEPQRLKDLRPVLTVVGGQVVFAR